MVLIFCPSFLVFTKDNIIILIYFVQTLKYLKGINGKLVAEQNLEKGSITATFKVPYSVGKLVAHSYEGDKEIASQILTIAGKPVAIRLKADHSTIKANLNDLAYVQVEIIDEAGNIVQNIDDKLIRYGISGNGSLAGVGNGNPRDMSSFQKPEKKVFQGKGLVIIRPNGKAGTIKIVAKAEGLKNGVLTVKSN